MLTRSERRGSRDRVAIYTAIFGGYDLPKLQPSCYGADFVCFTDNETLQPPGGWRVRVCRPRYDHPRLAAKWFKTRPDKALPQYRYTIWIDGSVAISTDAFASQVLASLNNSGLALCRHPDRDSVFDEVPASLEMRKYKGLPLREQVEHYRAQGYDGNNGLYAAGILVRDSANERIRRLGRLWMEENIRWSYQDQLSLPYLLWRLGLSPGIIPYYLWDNPLFRVLSHMSDL